MQLKSHREVRAREYAMAFTMARFILAPAVIGTEASGRRANFINPIVSTRMAEVSSLTATIQ